MRRIEQGLQRAIVQYLRYTLPREWIVAHIPNGGWRSKAEGAILKSIGTYPGLPDIMILGDDEASARVWWIEVKAPKGRSSSDQVACHTKLRELGFGVAIVRDIEETRALVKAWKLPTKEIGL